MPTVKNKAKRKKHTQKTKLQDKQKSLVVLVLPIPTILKPP